MGKPEKKTSISSGYELPWDNNADEIICENTASETLHEETKNVSPQISLAVKLKQASRSLANLRSEMNQR
jgi:hypothetical protein